MGKIIEGLTKERIGAIVRSLDVGLQLQKDFPEIADDYRGGMFISEITSKYDLCSKYGYNREVIKTAVKYALKGHGGGLMRDSFDGLLEEGELERLAREHKKRSGTQLYDRGLGIHGVTSEQKAEWGRRSHKLKLGVHARTKEQMSKDAMKAYEMRVGIHALTREQRVENAGKAGRRARELGVGIHGMTHEQRSEHGRKIALLRGQTPWKLRETFEDVDYPYSVLSEKEFAYRLSQDPRYKWGRKANNTLIAKKLNELYHGGKQIRTRLAVSGTLANLRKQKCKTR